MSAIGPKRMLIVRRSLGSIRAMKWVAFVAGELVLLALLSSVIFSSLLYQPTIVWIAVSLAMLAAFVAVASLAKSKPTTARLVALLAPFPPIANFPLSFDASLRS